MNPSLPKLSEDFKLNSQGSVLLTNKLFTFDFHSISYSNVIHLLEYAIPLSVCLSVTKMWTPPLLRTTK